VASWGLAVIMMATCSTSLFRFHGALAFSKARHAAFASPYQSAARSSQSLVQLFSTSSGKARILFLGTPEVAATSLKAIVEDSKKEDSKFEVVGVVTQPPKRRKRKGKVIPSPVGLLAEELNIPVLCPEKARDPDFLDELENEIRPDLCITAAYGQYLPKRFLGLPKFGTLNIHPSLLPRWRGASPVQRSLEAGDNPVGVSVLFTVSKMDAGPVVSQTTVDIDENDQATTVLPMLFDVGTASLLEAIPRVLSGEMTMETVTQQDESQIVNADMIDASEAEICVWKESAVTCHNRMRGFSMWPGIFMYVQISDGDADEPPIKFKVGKTRVAGLPGAQEPTDIIELGPEKGDGLLVVCGDGSVLELLEVQPVTRKLMDAKSFANGLRGRTLRWVKGPEPAAI